MKLDPLVNQLVRFKPHECADTYEATILAFDETGYWVRGGSLCNYLNNGAPCGDADTAFIEFRRIHSIQRVTT